MPLEEITVTVPEEYHLQRIDTFLASSLEMDLSRSFIQKLIKQGHILAAGNRIKANYKVKTDDVISITIPEPEVLDLIPQNIPLEILYEDDFVAVINKQPGLVVHPGPGNYDRTMVNALLYHLKGLSSIGGVERPGIVHRLDKDTSGLMVVAKNDVAHQKLVNEFSERRVEKRYTVIVVGKPHNEHEVLDMPIARHRQYRHKMTIDPGGRDALTEYWVKKIWNTTLGIYSLLDVKIHTGRTHQIRVHLSSQGLPVVGDPVYSKKWQKYRVPYLLLASSFLAFSHPADGRRMEFKAPWPPHIIEFIDKLERLSLSNI